MKLAGFLAGGALAAFVAGCASPYTPFGVLITETKSPLTLTVEGDPNANLRRGEATITCVLGLVSTGDCSIPTAMRNGNIQKISHVNYEYKNYLGILQEGKVVVYGE